MTKPTARDLAARELADLARLARDGGLDLSQVSLRVKADLLLSAPRPPRDDLAAFAEMATALIPSIDEATALILARKLAGWRHTPMAVLLALRARGGAVFTEMLRHGLPLGPAEIERLAETGDAEMLAALALRRDLTGAATLMLVERDSPSLDLALIANADAPLPRAAADLLMARARSRPAYQPGLLGRSDLSNLELAPLFLRAHPERRLTILDSLAAHEALHPGERHAPLAAAVFADWLALANEDRGAGLSGPSPGISAAARPSPKRWSAMPRASSRHLPSLPAAPLSRRRRASSSGSGTRPPIRSSGSSRWSR